jgi:hypothetical protein
MRRGVPFYLPCVRRAFLPLCRCRRVSLAVFGHVLDLDLSFHLSRKTGEVTKVVDRGTSAIQNVLSTILFQIVPQVRASTGNVPQSPANSQFALNAGSAPGVTACMRSR